MLDDDLFVSDALIERAVEIGGKVHKLHFREIPAVEFLRFTRLTQEGNDDRRDGAAAKLVAASVCNPDGTPAMTYEKALTLKSGPLNVIFAVVLDINGARPGNV
jgi:hypothetical protein